MRKNFFPLRAMEPWPRLPREAGESPSLEIFQPRLAAVLCSLLWVTLLGQGVGLGDPQRSLPTPAVLGFRDSVLVFLPDKSVCVGALCVLLRGGTATLIAAEGFADSWGRSIAWQRVLPFLFQLIKAIDSVK